MFKKLLIVFSVSIFCLVAYSYWDNNKTTSSASLSAFARVVTPAKNIDEFALNESSKRIFNNDSLRGRWSFVFLGYTHCPDICPTTLARFSAIYPQLKQLAKVQLVFISADPLRDNVDDLHSYVSYFSDEFRGVTASHNKLYPFTQALYLPYTIVAEKKSEQYSVGHSASIALIDPEGKLHAIFKPSYNVGDIPIINMQQLVKDFNLILNQAKPS
ncbi:MAG: SCO family protein [Litorilituus sp.]|jgi:protein SCO1/2|nr:SCO family protein [Litorilituus sp.]